MNPEDSAVFLKRRGFHVIRTSHCWWFNEYHQSRMYYSFPQHRLIAPQRDELKRLFQAAPGAFAFRFLSPMESSGSESFTLVCRRPYDLSHLSGTARNQTRKGMELCKIKAMTFDELIPLAWEAYRDTLERHKTKVGKESSLGFSRDLQECSAYEVWGAFVEGHLAAYLITLWVEDWVYILVNRSANAYLKFCPNNALIFTVVQQLLSRPGVLTVSYGWESLSSLESLEHFKLGMGFVKEPARQRIVLAPWLKPFFNPFMCRAIEKIAAFKINDSRLQRLAGFCRIVRESQG